MLGKNRIRRIEGLQRCCRLSVLDLHGNRITQISGLDNLAELKVLNLAGNQIRKICYMQGLISLEELVSTTYILLPLNIVPILVTDSDTLKNYQIL